MNYYQVSNEEDIQKTLQELISSDLFPTDPNQFRFCEISQPFINGIFKYMPVSKGISISLTDIKTTKPMQFNVKGKMPHFIKLSFILGGSINSSLKEGKKEFSNYQGQGHISIAEGQMESQIMIPGDQNIQLLEIYFTPEAFENYCRESGHNLPYAIAQASKNRKTPITTCSFLPPQKIQKLIYELKKETDRCNKKSLVIEEICTDLAIDVISYLDEGMGSIKTILSAPEIEKIREAKHILEKRMDDPPTIHELSRITGLNDYKIKTGFRQAFGKTPHQTLTEMRLEKAKKLIEEGNKSISDVGTKVGYHNPGDFSAAFRKKFGSTPSEMRKALGIRNL